VFFSETDQTSGAVVCRPVSEVEGLGQVSFAAARIFKLLLGLPVPP
jgi:hypothetical protein